MTRVVIVGAGQGGLQAAAGLRQEGFPGEILLIGDEPGLPYQRPPLSKAYLKTGEADKLTLRNAEFFEQNRIALLTSQPVDAIDRTGRHVTLGQDRFSYDHLILATGARNSRPPIPGIEAAFDLRTLAHARHLREALQQPRKIAVIGGGFIGLEFASVAQASGHKVTVCEAADRLMSRVLSAEMAQRFRDMHQQAGTVLHFGNPVTGVSDDGVSLADGRQIVADMVLLAAGVVPNTELADRAGLTVSNGIKVNAMLQTDDPAISALGDCAAFPNPRTGGLIRLESVQAATDHARHIARRLAQGARGPYAAVPWFWSDQADWKLQIAGNASPSDKAHLAENGAVLRFADDTLTAVETINNPRTHMKARRLLAGGEPVPKSAALKELA